MMHTHELTARAYADSRLTVRAGPRDMRSFVITTIWVLAWEQPTEGNRWDRVLELMGIPGEWLWSVLREDAPRWQMPVNRAGARGPCEAPGIRKPLCGRKGCQAFRVTNPEDGTWRLACYCDRHQAEARAAMAAERVLRASGTLPEPVPNTGGLLPCYFEWDWVTYYARARPGWAPPALGVCADAWQPAGGPPAPRLSLIRIDGEADAPPGPAPEWPVPALTVVRDEK